MSSFINGLTALRDSIYMKRQKECIVSEYTEHQVKERKDLKISGRIAANSENESLWADVFI